MDRGNGEAGAVHGERVLSPRGEIAQKERYPSEIEPAQVRIEAQRQHQHYRQSILLPPGLQGFRPGVESSQPRLVGSVCRVPEVGIPKQGRRGQLPADGAEYSQIDPVYSAGGLEAFKQQSGKFTK